MVLFGLVGLAMMESGLFGDDGTNTFLPFLMMSPGEQREKRKDRNEEKRMM